MSRTYHLTVTLEKQKGQVIAHCLEFDLVTSGRTEQRAQEMILDSIREYISYAVENDLEYLLFRPAPVQYWERLTHSKNIKRIHFKLNYPSRIIPEIDFSRVLTASA